MLLQVLIYGEYYKIKDNYCINPGLNHGAVPQGIAVDEDRDIVLTTAYMKDKSASRIYLTNSKNEQKIVSLNEPNSDSAKAFEVLTKNLLEGTHDQVTMRRGIGQIFSQLLNRRR